MKNLREEIKELLVSEFVSPGFYDYEKWDSPAIDKLVKLSRSFALDMLRDSEEDYYSQFKDYDFPPDPYQTGQAKDYIQWMSERIEEATK